ncbi:MULTISPECIES: preprotein translocase subunit SecE [Clostridium]|uniref:Protein translocase subunit SecE n=1 Tax=Clostridium senegalense TaxID=1465809 RepID=A0A6M0H7K1_9CLOT|nr:MULTISPECIES: preprotein translocase subunit SecE [Clostridium]MBU5226941.1 preprotein translocase subunit SecE [Clostridium senegalense]NEU06537.1 preprotein translocase subunit SecE [Clostridium senegalense]
MAKNVEKKSNTKKKRSGVIQFFVDLKAEFKRVTWPSKKEIKKASGAVISFCLLYVILVGLLDTGFNNLFKMFFK